MQLLSGSKTTLKKVKLWAKLLGLVRKGYMERKSVIMEIEGMVLWAAMGET
jgi:hypothetical protein